MAQLQTPSARASTASNSLFFLFIILLTAANLRAPITSTGPILEDIRAAFGLSASAAGLLNFIPLMLFALIAPIASMLGNRAGLEKSLWVAVCLIMLGSLLRISAGEPGLWLGTLLLSSGIAAANVLLPRLLSVTLNTTQPNILASMPRRWRLPPASPRALPYPWHRSVMQAGTFRSACGSFPPSWRYLPGCRC
ncbi:hypothetical protein O1V64_16535 [Rouxiella badensis]|nr:hypothetical protein O1V64_16535 [Rouxiella badensis]